MSGVNRKRVNIRRVHFKEKKHEESQKKERKT